MWNIRNLSESKGEEIKNSGRRRVSKLLLALTLVLNASFGLAAAPFPELTHMDMAKLAERELVFHSRNIPGRPWPEITIFALINSSPVEAAALFSHYEDHKKYIPDLIKSDPSRKVSENETIVDFEMAVPWPLANSRYSTGNVCNKLADNDYQISWYLVASDSLVDSKGTVRFSPYGTKTLLKYKSFIYPHSKAAFLFSSKVKSGTTKTVNAIVSYIEETKKNNPEKIQKLIDSLPR